MEVDETFGDRAEISMSGSVIMDIHDAPWVHGGPNFQDAEYNQQSVGSREFGPWISIITVGPESLAPAHKHSEDEVIFVVDGELSIGDRLCGPGTVIFVGKDTEYGFVTGSEGVKFLNFRGGPAEY